ncbi:MAG: prohibitin family protein [Myxococcaceae bacterium]|nr:prohibitin family protein [Myxococcaceae bacterium]
MNLDPRRTTLVSTLLLTFFTSTGCAVIQQGTVGVKKTWGRLDPAPLEPGLVLYEAISTEVLTVPIRTTTVTVNFTLPSKEGLNVDAQMSILYRIEPERAPDIIATIGPNYEDDLVVAVFRSAAADVSARFYARDMYSAERAHIEREIRAQMATVLASRGFVVESVLMKSIALPQGLAKAIETKLQSEQEAERMQFLIAREKLEADRKRIEAEGYRDAQKVVADGLTESVLRLRAIEAFRALSTSPNTKVIVTDGKAPLQVPVDARP